MHLQRWSAVYIAVLGCVLGPWSAHAAGAPEWMHSQLSAPLPPHDEKTIATVLYAESILSVDANGKMRRLDRQVIKILRPDGESRGIVRVNFDSQSRIIGLHAWCIPTSGKDYEVKERDVAEVAVGVDGGELVSDLRQKILLIPAATIGSVVGYEIEQEVRPYLLVQDWDFQDTIPVRETHFTLRLPSGWSYRANWLNHVEETPTEASPSQWNWSLSQLPPVKMESRMPPWLGISGRMTLAVVPPNGKTTGIHDWHDFGDWYLGLAKGRRDSSPDIKRKVAELTSNLSTPLEKMRSIARFIQKDIRYVAIELGIGGLQPHTAVDVYSHRYGDCKDKVTLMSAMLKEIGIDSYYVLINTVRGSVVSDTPPNLGFNHAILAILLPSAVVDPSLVAQLTLQQNEQLLFFDPTDEFTSFGQLSGALQANYGLVATDRGGVLVRLPLLPGVANGIERTAKMSLDDKGTLRGDVHEVLLGDKATGQRYALRAVDNDADRIKPLESMVGESLASYLILKASVANLRAENLPFEWNYTLEAENYAKTAGDLVLVRPRILGSFSSGLMETKEPRQHPVEFSGLEHDTDVFEIVVPPHYEVDELPQAVKLDYGFAAYQSQTEWVGHVLRYTRTFDIKEVTVPVAKAEQLKQLFRQIEFDERNSVVLKTSASVPASLRPRTR